MSNNKSVSNKISNNKISNNIKMSKKNYLKNIQIYSIMIQIDILLRIYLIYWKNLNNKKRIEMQFIKCLTVWLKKLQILIVA